MKFRRLSESNCWRWGSCLAGVLRLGMVLSFGAAVAPLGAQTVVEWVERSDPEGVFASETRYIDAGTAASTRTAPTAAADRRFVEWQINGVAQRDALGVSLNPVTEQVTAPVTAVAFYLNANLDTLGDGVADADKRYWYDDTSVAADSDTDGDGFTFAEELRRGYHPRVADDIVEGGIAGRRSAAIEILTDLTKARFIQRSEPAVFEAVGSWVDLDSEQTLMTAPASGSGYRFIGWFLDGVRLDDSTTPPPYTVTVDGSIVEVVARYVLESADTDADGVPDWQEQFYHDELSTISGPDTDTDGDGFGFAEELLRGYQPLYGDDIVEGGIAGRRSELYEILTDLTLARFLQISNPAVFETVGRWVDLNSEQTLMSAPASGSGYRFIGWFRDGTRLDDSAVPPPYTVTVDASVVEVEARYVLESLDSDTDGVADWQEQFYYNGLGTVTEPGSDSDGDGFGFAEELNRGYQPLFADTLIEGGIAGRRSVLFAILQLPGVFAWGDNTVGQLAVPWALSGRDVVAIASGAYHSLALTADGLVYAWGDNTFGQSTVPILSERIRAIAAGEGHSLAILEDGSVIGWGRNDFGQANPPTYIRNAVAVAAGATHSMALTAEGVVYCWGDNAHGQAQTPSLDQSATAIAAGAHFSVVLLADGSLMGWGRNQAGQLDFDADGAPYSHLAAGSRHTLAVDATGVVRGFGDNSDGQATPPADLTANAAVTGLVAGATHSLARFEDGSIVGWGRNDAQQAEEPSNLSRALALSAGAAHSVAIREVSTAPVDETVNTYRLSVRNSRRGGILRTPFKARYAEGETVTLTAVPRPGFAFNGWTRDVAGSANPLTLTLDADVTIGADFVLKAFEDWESTHFGGTGQGPVSVLKGGQSVNLQTAFLLGEDPTNPFDVVRVRALNESRGPRLRFKALAGRAYQVERSLSLAPGSWQPFGAPFIGEDAEVEIPYTVEPGGPAFYRLNITLPESP